MSILSSFIILDVLE